MYFIIVYLFLLINHSYEQDISLNENHSRILEKETTIKETKPFPLAKFLFLIFLVLIIITAASVVLYWNKIRKFFIKLNPFIKFSEDDNVPERTDNRYNQGNSIGIRSSNVELR
jgi:hypothetical protein